jgi:hypothetical protein
MQQFRFFGKNIFWRKCRLGIGRLANFVTSINLT